MLARKIYDDHLVPGESCDSDGQRHASAASAVLAKLGGVSSLYFLKMTMTIALIVNVSSSQSQFELKSERDRSTACSTLPTAYCRS
ncbi:hypothetical protein H1R20_g15387, partial [Candolleomyces eurysporus]